jgi:hypothetical protein
LSPTSQNTNATVLDDLDEDISTDDSNVTVSEESLIEDEPSEEVTEPSADESTP